MTKVGELFAILKLKNKQWQTGLQKSGLSVTQFKNVALGAFKAIGASAVVVGGVAVALGTKSVMMASQFDKGMREVNTLAQLSEGAFSSLKQQVIDTSNRLGKDSTEMTKSLYQVVSAGYEGANAMKLLGIGTKMAIGGVAGQMESVDALTTVMNAYELQMNGAMKAADTFFYAVKYGKTTMGELAGTIGRVATISHNVGVSFQEVSAALSALTVVGVKTDEAITGLKQLFMSVLKPSKQAKDAAKEMGLEFTTAALKSKGLSEFLGDVIEATGAESEELAKLFPNARAITAILPLATNAADKFHNVLDIMNTKTGALNSAVDQMNRSFSRQVKTIGTRLKNAYIGLGEVLIPVISKIATEFITPETINAVSNAMLTFGEISGMALLSLPEYIGNVKIGMQGLNLVITKGQKLHANFMYWIMHGNKVLRAGFKELAEEHGKHIEEIENNMVDTLVANKKLQAEYDELKAKLKAYIEQVKLGGGAQDDLNEKFIFSTVPLGPYRIELERTGEALKTLVNTKFYPVLPGPYTYEIDKTTESVSKLEMAQETAAQSAGRLFGQIIKGGMKAGDVLKGLVSILLRFGLTVWGGPGLSFAGGTAMGLFGMQHGGLLRDNSIIPLPNIPTMSRGLATTPTIPVMAEHGQTEIVATPEDLLNMVHVQVISADPNTMIRKMIRNMDNDIKQELFEKVIAPEVIKEGYR